jgi:hypothetical protein
MIFMHVVHRAVDIPYAECKKELEAGATPIVGDQEWVDISERFQAVKQAHGTTDASR